MRTIRVYQPGQYVVSEQLELSEAAGQHVGVVLRQKPGDKLILFPGDNREFDAEIVTVHKKKVAVHIVAERVVNRESPRMIHLAQAISKGDRMEWVIQKAVELGVAAIHPLVTQHGAYKMDAERLIKKQHQWQAIAIAACEQCGRNQVPEISVPVAFQLFLQHMQATETEEIGLPTGYVLEPYIGKSLHAYEPPAINKTITLMIGPEGGFSDDEMAQILATGLLPLTLGPRILRTETAAIAALSVLQAAWGDL